MTDTSTEAVERLAHDCDLAKGALKDDFPSGQAIFGDCAATLRDLAKERDELKAENERLREVLVHCRDEIDNYIRQEYPCDHPVHERYRKRDFSANPARVALEGTTT